MKKTSIISFVIMALLVLSVNTVLGEMREMGRKPYISATYHDMMTKKTNQDMWNAALAKQSEFEKPYASDTYEEMQHYASPLPGFSLNIEDFDFENDPYAPADPTGLPWNVVFFCAVELCYCEGEERCKNLICTYPIIGVEPDGSCNGLSFKISGNEVCVEAESDPDWGCGLNIVMKTPPNKAGIPVGIVGRHYTKRVGECDDCCVPDATLAWDYGASAATVARNNSVTVAITGTGESKPFTWSVSGTGFTLDHASTTGLTNTLNADNTACGPATITVTGCDNVVATGYVRCTTGQWSDAVSGCKLSGVADTKVEHGTGMRMIKTCGKYKQDQIVGPCGEGGNVPCSEKNCLAYCTYGSCINCTECLDWECEDQAVWGASNRKTCGYHCCTYYMDEDCTFHGHCFNNKLLNYYEWICE